MAVVMALVGLLVVGVGRIGAEVIGRARAQAAADAAALAGAMRGRSAAEQFAAQNGARIVTYTEVAGDVRVEVRVEVPVSGGVSAVAQARPVSVVGPTDDLAPAMRAVLARAAQVTGGPVEVLQTGPGGLTVLVSESAAAGLAPVAIDSGLCPEPGLGPGWFGVCAASGPSVG